MKICAVAVVFGLLVGCAPPYAPRSPGAIAADAKAEAEAAEAAFDAELVWVDCLKAPRARKACGLLVDRYGRPENIAAYVLSTCQEDDPDHASEACIARLIGDVRSAMTTRYSMADVRHVEEMCDSLRSGCRELRTREQVMLLVHNQAAVARYEETVKQILARHELDQRTAAEQAVANAEAAERRREVGRAISAGFKGFADGMNASK